MNNLKPSQLDIKRNYCKNKRKNFGNQSAKNMSQVVQNNIIKSLDKLKKEIKIHNEDIATKQLTLNKTASYCQQVVEKVKGIFQENKLASDLIIECEDKINGTMSLIKENREKNILPKSENKPDSRDTQSFYNKFERENRFGLSISNQEQEEAKLSESNDRTSNQIKRISDNKAQFLIWSSLELRVKGYESILLQEKKKLTENFQKYCNSSVSTKHQDCCIELKTQNNIEYQMTSATVIPFNEQLRIQYLDNEYKELVSNAGKELTEACTKYKNQHFRLRTGLATVFPAGNLEFNNIIAAVPPITNNESVPQLLEKVILSILDIMLDHEFQSIMIPTFCTEDSEISEEQYIAILLKTLKEYIDENEQEMRGKRIGRFSHFIVYMAISKILIVICFKTLPLPERDEQLDSLVKKYSKRVLKIEKTKIQREDKGIESSKGEKYYQDSREETKDEKVELSNCDSPIPSKQADDLENQIILLQEKKQQLQEQITSLKSEISQLEQKKKFILEESFNETTRDRRDQEDLDQDPKADISATTGNEYLQKENIELEHNCEELKEKYLKLKAKKKEIKKKNIELENKNTELKNTNAQLEKQIEKDIEEYNELVKRYEKYRNRCRAYKSKEESKGIPKVPRKLSRDHSHPPVL
ncbi:unnamed protein product [Moneuplotes crassus]|uniref:Macro domain-containing protein n=1 Tax=Euplotes crassus TaxID=5936 RepID=A0AAD1XZ26_EUPCR|nr:unnamed protein product [Moneuplotes crassus]